jgi:alpha-L-fucosidase
VLLLNVPPDTRGRIADADVASLAGMRARLDRAFTAPAAEARPPIRAAGGGPAAAYEVPIGSGRRFDVALVQEDLRRGQRVEQFTLELCAAGACREFARGTTIGYKRLLRFPEVETGPAHRDARIRLTIVQARGTPAVSALGVYWMGTSQPQGAAPGVTR